MFSLKLQLTNCIRKKFWRFLCKFHRKNGLEQENATMITSKPMKTHICIKTKLMPVMKQLWRLRLTTILYSKVNVVSK